MKQLALQRSRNGIYQIWISPITPKQIFFLHTYIYNTNQSQISYIKKMCTMIILQTINIAFGTLSNPFCSWRQLARTCFSCQISSHQSFLPSMKQLTLAKRNRILQSYTQFCFRIIACSGNLQFCIIMSHLLKKPILGVCCKFWQLFSGHTKCAKVSIRGSRGIGWLKFKGDSSSKRGPFQVV